MSSIPYPPAAKRSQDLFPETHRQVEASVFRHSRSAGHNESLQLPKSNDGAPLQPQAASSQQDETSMPAKGSSDAERGAGWNAKGGNVDEEPKTISVSDTRPEDLGRTKETEESPLLIRAQDQGGAHRDQDQGGAHSSVDPEIFASLPPDIQRELRLASMMKMGGQKSQPGTQVAAKRSAATPRQPPVTAKRKKDSIASYFSAKQ